MIPFQPPAPTHRHWVLPRLQAEPIPLCDYGFANLCCWREAFSTKIAPLDQRLLIRVRTHHGRAYLWPAGSGDPAPALNALTRDAYAHGEPLRLLCLTAAHRDFLETRYPGRFDFTALEDNFDYLYEIDRLARLSGKKLHAKRNHIHRLDENCPGWTWSPLTPADIPACLALDARWHQAAVEREGAQGLRSLDQEHRALLYALEHGPALHMEGIVLRHGGTLLGFTLGSPLTPQVFDVNFERAREDIQGAYPAVTRSFARYIAQIRPAVTHLNREDDMGLPGLRRAKQSYYPDQMAEKYCAVETAPVFIHDPH